MALGFSFSKCTVSEGAGVDRRGQGSALGYGWWRNNRDEFFEHEQVSGHRLIGLGMAMNLTESGLQGLEMKRPVLSRSVHPSTLNGDWVSQLLIPACQAIILLKAWKRSCLGVVPHTGPCV